MPARYAEGYVIPPGYTQEAGLIFGLNACLDGTLSDRRGLGAHRGHTGPKLFPPRITAGAFCRLSPSPSRNQHALFFGRILPLSACFLRPFRNLRSGSGRSGRGNRLPGRNNAEPSALAKQAAAALLLFLGILSVPFVLFLLLFLQRKIRLFYPQKALFPARQKPGRSASVRPYQKLILYGNNKFLTHVSGLSEELEELVMKARFSQHMLTSEELGAIADFYEKQLENLLEERLFPPLCLYCKYILVLF